MTPDSTLLVVPVLAMVVLSTLLVTLNRGSRSAGLGTAGVFGVVLGGPFAILLLGPGGVMAASEATVVSTTEPLAPRSDSLDDAEPPDDATSVSPNIASYPIYPPDRPKWIKSPPKKLEGFKPIHVEAAPKDTRRLSNESFDEELRRATSKFINRYLESQRASLLVQPDLSEIKRHCLRQEYVYEGGFESSVGLMREKHALVVFDDAFRDEIDSDWRNVVATSRLLQTALIGGAVLGLLGVLFCYLRLDTATRGFYSGRLQFVTLAAILTLIAAGVLVARWIPWM